MMNAFLKTPIAILILTITASSIAFAKNAEAPMDKSGLNDAALQKLLARAKASNSDALIIYKDGNLVGEWYFNKPHPFHLPLL